MRYLPRQLELADEALQARRCQQLSVGQEFQGNRWSDAEVVGAIDGAASAVAKQSHDSVPFREHVSRRKREAIGRVAPMRADPLAEVLLALARIDPLEPARQHLGGRLVENSLDVCFGQQCLGLCPESFVATTQLRQTNRTLLGR